MNKAILGDQCAPELTNYLVAECERRRRGEWEKESRGVDVMAEVEKERGEQVCLSCHVYVHLVSLSKNE